MSARSLFPVLGDCLVDVQSLVVDGANRVCRSSPDGLLWFGLIAVAAAIVATGLLRQGGSWARRALPLLALAGALPGWAALLSDRADAPGRLAATSRTIESTTARFDAFASRHRCVNLTDNGCVACQPLAQFAFPACDGPPRGGEGRARLGSGAFSGSCQVLQHGPGPADDELVCGTATAQAR